MNLKMRSLMTILIGSTLCLSSAIAFTGNQDGQLTGMTVYDNAHHRVGTIAAVWSDLNTGRVEYTAIKLDKKDGMKPQTVLAPFSALHYNTRTKAFRVEASRDQLTRAPEVIRSESLNPEAKINTRKYYRNLTTKRGNDATTPRDMAPQPYGKGITMGQRSEKEDSHADELKREQVKEWIHNEAIERGQGEVTEGNDIDPHQGRFNEAYQTPYDQPGYFYLSGLSPEPYVDTKPAREDAGKNKKAFISPEHLDRLLGKELVVIAMTPRKDDSLRKLARKYQDDDVAFVHVDARRGAYLIVGKKMNVIAYGGLNHMDRLQREIKQAF
ncbi:MAG: hypothetical protein GC154_20115 [bacterium]|nr:hypothetical protein [bacterium]